MHCRLSLVLALSVALVGCSDDDVAAPLEEPSPIESGDTPAVGFEILQVLSPNEIRAWAAIDGMTEEEFDAIELPNGWFKNQPRETEMDGGRFLRSPDGTADGEFHEDDHFGHRWLHVATITELNQQLDPDGLFSGNTIRKFHEVTFDAGRTLTVVLSPEGVPYVRLTRDLNRESDTPTFPSGWQETEYTTPEELVVRLPDEILNIRADNEDSYQGPVSELEGVVGD